MLKSTPSAPLPSPPPGFVAKTEFKLAEPLDPNGVYLATISLMFALSEQAWSSEVDLTRLNWVPSPGGRVAIVTVAEAPGLQPGHIILAIYQCVLAMYSRRPGFDAVVVKIYLQERCIGKLVMLNPFDLPAVIGSRNSTLLGESMAKGTGSVMTRAGVLVDPENDDFRISWAFDGRPVPAQDIFSAVLDGIATTAQYDVNESCAYVTGVSFSGNLAFHISRISVQDLECGRISRAFLLISHWIIPIERIFTEMDFTLILNERPIAEGYIFKISSYRKLQ